AFVSEPLYDHKYSLSEHRHAIDRCFRFNTVEEIISELEKENTPFAEKTLKTLRTVSLVSLKMTLQQIREGARLGIADCFRMEYQLSYQVGIKALLIEKTLQPKWEPATTEEVDHEKMMGQYFSNQAPNTLSLSSNKSWMEYPCSRNGLPSEEEVYKIVADEIKGSGPLQLTAEGVAEVCIKKISGKIGVREKVMEFHSRKATKGAGDELKWIN
ncbi:hypothetical protein BG003_000851, partial [Podila horticola]